MLEFAQLHGLCCVMLLVTGMLPSGGLARQAVLYGSGWCPACGHDEKSRWFAAVVCGHDLEFLKSTALKDGLMHCGCMWAWHEVTMMPVVVWA